MRKNHSTERDPSGSGDTVPAQTRDVAKDREELAQLIGRMLASHWLRSKSDGRGVGDSRDICPREPLDTAGQIEENKKEPKIVTRKRM